MTEREDTRPSGARADEYGGVNQGAPGDAPGGDENAAGEVADIDEARQDEPNEGAPGHAPPDGDAAA